MSNKTKLTPQEMLEAINKIIPEAKYIFKDMVFRKWTVSSKRHNLVRCDDSGETYWEYGNNSGTERLLQISENLIEWHDNLPLIDSLHSIEEDEIPDENTPSGTLVEVSSGSPDVEALNRAYNFYFVGLSVKGGFIIENNKGYVDRYDKCRIKKGE